MDEVKLGSYIQNFVYLNPKQNKYPNFNKYDLNSFLIIQNQFKENKKYIITSNYDDIFYNKNEFLNGKKWTEILLSSKDIFEYHKKIRDNFPYCKQKKLNQRLIEDLFFWFDKNTKKIIIEAAESHFDIELRQKLAKIRRFLDDKDWSNYFFNLQKLMHEQIIKLLEWKGNFTYERYNKVLINALNNVLSAELSEYYLNFVQKVNLYRNTLSKIKPSENEKNKNLLNNWNNLINSMKNIEAKHIYNQLLDFIDIINLILNKKSL